MELRVSVIPSNVETTYEERRLMWRDLGYRGFISEDLNDTLDGRTEVVLAYEVVIELVERRQVRWADIVRVARDPEMLSLIYDLVCYDHIHSNFIRHSILSSLLIFFSLPPFPSYFFQQLLVTFCPFSPLFLSCPINLISTLSFL